MLGKDVFSRSKAPPPFVARSQSLKSVVKMERSILKLAIMG